MLLLQFDKSRCGCGCACGCACTDIIYAIRTGYRGANSYHNANRLTFKRLENFSKMADGLLSIECAETLPRRFVITKVAENRKPQQTVNFTATVDANATELHVVLRALKPASVQLAYYVDCYPCKATPIDANEPLLLVLRKAQPQVLVVRNAADGVVYRLYITRAKTSALRFSGTGFAVRPFGDGLVAWLNRGYTWLLDDKAKAALKGRSFTCINGGAGTKGAAPARITVDAVTEESTLYAALSSCKKCAEARAALAAAGFTNCSNRGTRGVGEVRYTDSLHTRLQLMQRSVAPGDRLFAASAGLVPQGAGWDGVILIF